MNPACLLCLLPVLFLLVGCSSPDPPPAFEVLVPSETDRVVSEFIDGEVRFDIYSETGIGSAEVKLASGQWPESILLRVHKSSLESFKFSYPDTVVEVAISSSEDRKVLRSAMQIGKELQSAGEGTIFYTPVEFDEDGTWIEIQTPDDFREQAPGGFRIDWIDVYR